MLALACLYLTLAKLLLALIPLGESSFAGEPSVSKVVVGQVIVGLAFIGMTLVPVYYKIVMPDPRRRRTRRILGVACCVDGAGRIIMDLWPTALYEALLMAGFVIVICFVASIFYDLAPYDDGPRKRKRRRIKAKWPSWIPKPKRWDVPPLPKPKPARQPSR